MNDARDGGAATLRRRDVLGAGAAASLGLGAGCLQRVRNLVDRPGSTQVSLEIKTPPADEDEPATRIAKRLADNLSAVGIDAELSLLREDELRRDVLVKEAFEVYVARMPVDRDPDFLRPRLHSVFVGETGWQNPFGLADIDVDEALADQRTAQDGQRRARIDDLQNRVASLQPFVPVAVSDDISAVRTDRFGDWPSGGLTSPVSYLLLSARSDEPVDRLRVTTNDDSVTANLNPIAVTQRDRGTFLGLLYDPLGRRHAGRVRPWLAADWDWQRSAGTHSLRVELRDGLTWHDGRDLTAGDVAFTYRFLSDTTMGEREAAVPAPRFRGRTTLVESVTVPDPGVVRIDVGETVPAVARRALTVPILPAHVWRSKSTEAELAGVGVNDRVTAALVWNNPEPVGSGPLAFEDRIDQEALYLRRNDDHFLHRDGASPWLAVADGVDFAELAVRVAPSTDAAVQLVAAAEADATVPFTDPAVAARIGREDALTLSADRSPFLYHVGFNTRIDPLGNPYVRRTVARLVDKAYVADEVFDGYARPVASPLADTDWLAPALAWDGSDPEVPFVGSDGELDVERARELFRDIGFQYQDEELLSR